VSVVSIPLTIRSTQRLGQIALALTRHGFGHLVHRLDLRAYLPIPGKLTLSSKRLKPDTEISMGRRLATICQELGPTFIKLGQTLSSRPDLLSAGIVGQLRKLQDRVEPFDTQTARQIIESDLSGPIGKLFAEFHDKPFASGSIAQVYRATTSDGQPVVVKVKRPSIEQTIKLDMHILRWMAENIERYVPELAPYRPVAVIEEFAQSINREMDLLREAAVTSKFAQFFQNDPHIAVPSVRWNLTGDQVLTVTYLSGQQFYQALENKTLGLDRQALARHLLDAFLRQYLELGVYHADPHPGNLLLSAPSCVGLVDFGMVGQLDRTRSVQLTSLLVAVNARELDLAVDMLSEMAALGPKTNPTILKRDLSSLLDKYQGLPIGRIDLARLFSEISELARINHMILPQDFVMVGKSLVTIGGVALELDRQMSLTQVIQPRIRKLLIDQASPGNMSRELSISAWHTTRLLKDTPRQLRELTRRILRGQLTFQVNNEHMDLLIRELDRSSNRISFSMIVAAIIIGSSLMFHARVGPTWYGIPLLGLTGYLVAAIMGMWLVVAILRSGKLS